MKAFQGKYDERAGAEPKRKKKKMGADERALILDCYDAGWDGGATARLIFELYGTVRSSKVIRANINRKFEYPQDAYREIGGQPSAAERIPDYRGLDDAFVAAMRAAPECPPEGIYKDPRPLIVTWRPTVHICGRSVAADVADLGSCRGARW